MYFPEEEYEERWTRVYREMEARGVDTALIWSRSGGTHDRSADVLYLTHYYSNVSGHGYDLDEAGVVGRAFSAVIMGNGEVPELVPDLPEYPPPFLATDRVSWPENRGNVIRSAAQRMKARKIEGTVALVGEQLLPVKYSRILEEELPDVRFVPADDLVETVRRFKSTRELDCYREAGEKVSIALKAQIETALRGGTQADAAAAGAAELMRRGGVPHMVPIASGIGTDLDYFAGGPIVGFSPDKVLSAGDIIRTWLYGPIWQGYWLDPGRTAIVGKAPSHRQRELITAANGIVERLIEAVKPGVKASTVAGLGKELSDAIQPSSDATSRMFPLFGHGIGLSWERPQIWSPDFAPTLDDEFREGQTLGVEAFINWPDVGSAGVEQNIIVGAHENELLTTTELEWW